MVYITELYYGIVLRNQITELYHLNIVRNYPYGKHPRETRGVHRSPWDSEDIPGTLLGPLGTPLGPPRDHWDTPMDHKNSHIAVNVYRQKLSLAASEYFRCNASIRGLL